MGIYEASGILMSPKPKRRKLREEAQAAWEWAQEGTNAELLHRREARALSDYVQAGYNSRTVAAKWEVSSERIQQLVWNAVVRFYKAIGHWRATGVKHGRP